MGFLLLATVIFLLYVFGALVGNERVYEMLGALLLFGLAAWIYGRWSGPVHSLTARTVSFAITFLLAISASAYAAHLASEPAAQREAATTNSAWQNWTPDAVDAALAQGKPVFVDFTAAWCLSCKVNERLALESADVKSAFAQKNVALFRADWTHSDPAITKALQDYQRDGVPLYLLYSPKDKKAQVLPEVLTPGIVLEALGNI
jgi:thiol:disulfide interchange protein DsbD